MYYIHRVFQALMLFIKKISLHGNLILKSPIYKYDVQASCIKCGNNGEMILGQMNTQTNVHLVSWGGKLTIGNGCGFNRNVIIVSRNQISIGDKVLIGPNVCIYDHDHKFGGEGIIDNELNYGTVSIGNNVWIGAGTIVLKNTIIGNNCVIGAGCVVSGNIPDYSLVTTGNRDLKIEKLHK